MTFKIRQRIVCIKTNERAGQKYKISVPHIGEIYTIRNFENRGKKPALRLIEIINTDNRAQPIIVPMRVV